MLKLRLPAEWERQFGVQLTWPHKETEWKDDLDLVEPCLAKIAKEISLRQKVLIICHDHEHTKSLLIKAKANLDNIKLVVSSSNDIWARDHSAITIYKNDEPLLLDFAFNGWGLKYKANHDNQITRQLGQNKIIKNNIQTLGLVLEGGSIESDGQSTVLTTSQCLLSANRNPHLSKAQIEESLKDFLGTTRVLWLNHGYIAGDDTDCHIDTLARFCNQNTICYISCNNPQDEHFEELQLMEQELKTFKTFDGKPYNLIPLPLTSKPIFADKIKLPATYANFLIINKAVLMPLYNDEHDELALEIMQKVFPERKIIGIDCTSLILQRGSLHCATMQFPEGVIW